MKIIFDSINETTYFNEAIGSDNSAKKEKIKNQITIGKLNRRSKNEYQNLEISIENLSVFNNVDIYLHQLKNDGLQENKISLLHVLGFLNSKGYSGKVNIYIITDHYNYYYKEFFSVIFCDTDFQNSFKANTLKTALVILIQKYFGFRLTHFLKVVYYRLRRLLRR